MKTYQRRRGNDGTKLIRGKPDDDQKNQITHDIELSSISPFKGEIIPTGILLDIFSRLPIASVINCKSVCKEWYGLISDSNFSINYYARNSLDTTILLLGCNYKKLVDHLLFFIGISKNGDYIQIQQPVEPKLPDLIYTSRPKDQWLSIVGWCNGLVCVCVHENCTNQPWEDIPFPNNVIFDRVYVVNPISGRAVASLPKCVLGYRLGVNGGLVACYRFGFCPTTKEFKILRNVFRRYPDPHVLLWSEIFTVGADDHSWRRVPDACPFISDRHAFGYYRNNVVCNGAIHWTVSHQDADWVCDWVRAFDLEEEKYCLIAYPSALSYTRLSLSPKIRTDLTLLDNRLCVFTVCDPLCIWSMKEYGVAESWTKDIILKSCMVPSELRPWRITPVTMLQNGDILFSTCLGCFFSYNPVEEKCSRIKLFDDETSINLDDKVTYSMSFFLIPKAYCNEI